MKTETETKYTLLRFQNSDAHAGYLKRQKFKMEDFVGKKTNKHQHLIKPESWFFLIGPYFLLSFSQSFINNKNKCTKGNPAYSFRYYCIQCKYK